MMASERWQQIDDLFEAALDRPRESRRSFIESQQDLSSDVVEEVLAMVAAHERCGDFMDDGAADAAADLIAEEASAAPIPDRIGPLKVLEQIARGGMGSVYLAERDDGTFVRRVAVKVLQPGLDAPAVRRRFLSERQILASLEHENVARIYDGGIFDDGRPYFVMEFVDGLPLDRHCEEHSCSLEKRLSLLLDVADTVQFAHRNLVVHRDIKPSNILVTDDGHVKLLDFGIAKVLEGEGADGSITQTGTRWMTPQYAAPEQILGEPATTATDVYQLGVIAYQILTGVKPFPGNGRSAYEVHRSVCEDNPRRPSQAVSENPRGRPLTVESEHLRGDLDAIVMCALRKSPEDRYASAGEFAEDLRRFLRSEPVQARRGSLAYRWRKFVRRNRWWVVASIALLLALAGYVWTLVEQREEIAHERDRAERFSSLLVELFSASDPLSGSERSARDLTVYEFLEGAADHVERSLVDDPEIQAKLLSTLSEMHVTLDEGDRGIELAQRAIRLAEQSEEGAPIVVENLLRAAYVGISNQSFAAADSILARAEVKAKDLGSVDQVWLGRAYSHRALYYDGLGKPAEADSLGEIAVAILERADGVKPQDLASALLWRSRANMNLHRLHVADSLIRLATKIREGLVGNDHPRIAIYYSNGASIASEVGDYERSEHLFRRAIAIFESELGETSSYTLSTTNNLGVMLARQGKHGPAVDVHRQNLKRLEEKYGTDHVQTAYGLKNLGGSLAALGLHEEAEPLLLRAYDVFRRDLPPGNPIIASPMTSLAEVYAQRADYDKAERWARDALEHLTAAAGETHPFTAIARLRLAAALIGKGVRVEAREHLLLAVGVLADSKGYATYHDEATRLLVSITDLVTDSD